MKPILILTLAFFASLITAFNAKALTDGKTRIQITQGIIQADPIAIHRFLGQNNIENILAQDIAAVITNDLKNSGVFAPLDEDLFPQKNTAMTKESMINFSQWQMIRARFIVTGKIMTQGAKITLEFRLYDVFLQKQILGQTVEVTKEKWRRLAHAVSDLIYTRITNEAGFFNTQIVYSQPHGKGRKSTTQLHMMDYDGYNDKTLTNAKNLVLTPRFAPDGKTIAYLKIHHNKAEVFLMNLETRHNEKLGDFEGMSFAPRFGPDGKTIVMSLSQNGKSAIYTMNLEDKNLTRLTDHFSIDTSPCYSPDGSHIVFTSDRSGKEHLYIMNTDGSDVKRISFDNDGKYSQPVWSPRGDLIAFTKQVRIVGEGSKFYIGVMAPDGTGERTITDGWLVEDPSWAGNGRYLIFTKQFSVKHTPKLYMVDLTGYTQSWISTKGAASNGTWSPLVAHVETE